MSYYDTVIDPSSFRQRSKGSDGFSDLTSSGRWRSAVSQWDRSYLFAHRVICKPPKPTLQLFESRGLLSSDLAGTGSCINALIQGPESINALQFETEPQLVHSYQPDSLAYVWAALASLIRARAQPSGEGDSSTVVREASKRVSRKPENPGFVPSDQIDSQSSQEREERDRGGSPDSDKTHSSMGYVEGLAAPLVEDATVRLASCFIRCVLNYGQPRDQTSPFLYFCDERQTFAVREDNLRIHAVDGSIRYINDTGTQTRVAMLEGKRTFAKVVDGQPIVSDELLGQMVGEAIAARYATVDRISSTDFVTIHASNHFVKFFHFHMDEAFGNGYSETFADLSDHLVVFSTVWFNVTKPQHRADIVRHILGLVSWAQQLMP